MNFVGIKCIKEVGEIEKLLKFDLFTFMSPTKNIIIPMLGLSR